MTTNDSVRLLFVCTANVCRSPMAAGMMAYHSKLNGAPVEVSSASVDQERRQLHPMIATILSERHVSLGRTESQPVTEALAAGADFILTMTADHAISVVGRFADSKPKVFLLNHFGEVLLPAGKHEDVDAWLDGLRNIDRDYSGGSEQWDIPDPMGQAEPAFRAVAAQIDEVTGWIATVLSTVNFDDDVLATE